MIPIFFQLFSVPEKLKKKNEFYQFQQEQHKKQITKKSNFFQNKIEKKMKKQSVLSISTRTARKKNHEISQNALISRARVRGSLQFDKS